MSNEIPLILHKAHIQGIAGLAKGHPVFRLFWNDNPGNGADRPFILKGDPGSKETMSAAYGLMREVARGVRWRVLDGSETRWLFEVAATGNGTDPDTQAFLAKLKPAGYTWVIMGNKAALLELDDVINKNDAGTAAAMLAAMSDEENQRRLGAILVVDMFMNNTDRFEIMPNSRGITNKGNVFFVRKGDGKLRIKGLDPFDYTKSKAQLETVVGTTKDHTDAGWWSGIMIRKDAELERVAKSACESLNQELGAVMRAGGYHEKVIKQLSMSRRDIKEVVSGMKEARQQIRNACTARMGRMGSNQQAQTGLRSRMQALGWAK